jgi:hypothetical protein
MTDTLPLGSNVLVTGTGPTAALRYALDQFGGGDGTTAVVSAALPAATVLSAAGETSAGGPSHVVDCSGQTSSKDAAGFDAPVTVAGSDVPSVGEATVQALDDATPPAALCLDAVSAVAERSSVQQTYKLLYLVAERVRAHEARAVYTWRAPVETKTLRILGRPLDDTVRLGADDALAPEAGAGDR